MIQIWGVTGFGSPRFQASCQIALALAAQMDFSFLFLFERLLYSGPSLYSETIRLV